MKPNILITCEHGGNHIPLVYQYLFKGAQDQLNTHQGLDIGALGLAKVLAKNNADFYLENTISRLLIDYNRSLHHKNLFSSFTQSLSALDKLTIINRYYLPFRRTVQEYIQSIINKNIKVLHVSVHSFTPILNNHTRNTDIGLLYDPQRNHEKQVCTLLKKLIKQKLSIKTRSNYPYLGTADGFTSYLRKCFSEKNYIGIELEVNQTIFTLKNQDVLLFKKLISEVLHSVIDEYF
jgi:predicted N-formylglutamate amidohydrolase